jgi:hypothetical protein
MKSLGLNETYHMLLQAWLEVHPKDTCRKTQMSSSSARVLHNAHCSPQSEEIWDITCNKSPKCCTEGGNLKKQL